MISKNIIATILILLFSISVGVIGAMYVRGYNINRDDDNGQTTIVKGGNLLIETTPKDASLYVNDKLSGKTPEKIVNIIPGEYKVKVDIEKYNAWQKTVLIKEGLVTEIKINLIKIDPVVGEIETNYQVASVLTTFSNDQKLLYKDINGNLILADFSRGIIKNNNNFVLLVEKANYDKLAILETTKYSLSPDGLKLMLFNPTTKETRVIAANTLNSNLDNMILSFDVAPENVSFASDSETILLEKKPMFFSYNTRTSKTTLLLNAEINPIYSFATKGYTTLQAKIVTIYDYDTNIVKSIKLIDLKKPVGSEKLVYDKINLSDDSNEVLLTSTSNLYYINQGNKTLELLDPTIKSFKGFSPDYNKAFYCTIDGKTNLSILDTSKYHGVARTSTVTSNCEEEFSFDSKGNNIASSLKMPEDLISIYVSDYDGQNKVEIAKGEKPLSDIIFADDLRIIFVKSKITETGERFVINEINLK